MSVVDLIGPNLMIAFGGLVPFLFWESVAVYGRFQPWPERIVLASGSSGLVRRGRVVAVSRSLEAVLVCKDYSLRGLLRGGRWIGVPWRDRGEQWKRAGLIGFYVYALIWVSYLVSSVVRL